MVLLLLLLGVDEGVGAEDGDGDCCSWGAEGVGVDAWYGCCCCCCCCVEEGGDGEASTTGEGSLIFGVDGAEISVKGRA